MGITSITINDPGFRTIENIELEGSYQKNDARIVTVTLRIKRGTTVVHETNIDVSNLNVGASTNVIISTPQSTSITVSPSGTLQDTIPAGQSKNITAPADSYYYVESDLPLEVSASGVVRTVTKFLVKPGKSVSAFNPGASQAVLSIYIIPATEPVEETFTLEVEEKDISGTIIHSNNASFTDAKVISISGNPGGLVLSSI